jgi:hypothetical protein
LFRFFGTSPSEPPFLAFYIFFFGADPYHVELELFGIQETKFSAPESKKIKFSSRIHSFNSPFQIALTLEM